VHEPGPGHEAERITGIRENERHRLAFDIGEPRPPEQARELPPDGAVAQVAVPPEVLDLAEQLGVGDVGDERLLIGIDGDDPPTPAGDPGDLVDRVLGPGTCCSTRSMRAVARAVFVGQRPGVGLQVGPAAGVGRLGMTRRVDAVAMPSTPSSGAVLPVPPNVRGRARLDCSRSTVRL
jgi:hypothetical protein